MDSERASKRHISIDISIRSNLQRADARRRPQAGTEAVSRNVDRTLVLALSFIATNASEMSQKYLIHNNTRPQPHRFTDANEVTIATPTIFCIKLAAVEKRQDLVNVQVSHGSVITNLK